MSKIKLQDFIKFGRLFEIYGELLSDDRQKIMTSYFEYNMTLVEIAEERGISRQAVLDAIDKGCEKLNFYEEKLHILEQKERLLADLNKPKETADKNDKSLLSSEIDEMLRRL